MLVKASIPILALFALAVSPVPFSPLAVPLPGYKVVHLEWDVQVTAGGPTIKATGNIQEVYAQLKKVNPDFEKEFPPANATNLKAWAADYTISYYFCEGRWLTCSWSAIEQGIAYLNGVPGRQSNGPGPGNCGRVSCSYNSAIWWCNDVRRFQFQASWASFYDIAGGANFVGQNCLIDTDQTSGQVFYAENWNVIVRGDSC